MRIDHIQLSAPPHCEDAARAFFVGVLGMRELPKPEALQARGGCWFTLDEVNLHIGVEVDFRPAKKAHPAMAVEDIDAWATRLTQANARVEWDELIPGRRRFFTDDPWGNRVEFLESGAAGLNF